MVDRGHRDSNHGRGEKDLVAAAWRQFEQAHSFSAVPKENMQGQVTPWLEIPGYRDLRTIGRGGQGVVCQAIQESTGRKVAIKLIRDGFADRDAARFEREIRVLGQLQHPNIVAIHDSGSAAGQFYYVMDYVVGHPLDEFADTLAGPLDAKLTLFIRVCDAVHQAHLRGIIHRDLKPANILVDTDGEPRILDFGLAKIDTRASDDASEATVTVPGQFLGSLPWASPEQALGRMDAIDVRSDVYSLGVTLYEMLTGAFPYPVHGTQQGVIDNILSHAPTPPSTHIRLDNDLETIVLKCLAKEPERRYQSAGDLARDVRHFLADEPVEAKRDSLGYVLRKRLRRHRVPVAVGAAFLLLLIAGTIVSTGLYLRADEQRRLAEQAELRANQRADELNEARESLEQVVSFQSSMFGDIDPQRLGHTLIESLRAEIRRAGPDHGEPVPDRLNAFDRAVHPASATSAALHVLDEEILARASNAIEDRCSGQPLVEASLRYALADIYHRLSLYEKSVQELTVALDIRRRELGEDDADTLKSVLAMGGVLRDMGRLDEAEKLHRQALEGRRRVLSEDHPDSLNTLNDLGALLRMMGRHAEAEVCLLAALEGLRRVQGDDHADTLTALHNLGVLLVSKAEYAEAEECFREALAGYRRTLGNDHPSTLTAMSSMGHVLWSQGRFVEAEPLLREVLATNRRVLGDDHPSAIMDLANLGVLLQSMGQFDDSEPYYREALTRFQKVLGVDHPATLSATDNLGYLLRRMERLDEAEQYYRLALAGMRRVLGDEHPDTLMSMNNLGFLLNRTDRLDEAEQLLQEAADGRRRVLGADHVDTAATLSGLVTVRLGQKRYVAAEGPARECVAIREKRLPGHWLLYHAKSLLGEVLAGQGRFAEAEPLLIEAYENIAPPSDRSAFRQEALERLVRFFDQWDKAEPNLDHAAKAAQWRAELRRITLVGGTPDEAND